MNTCLNRKKSVLPSTHVEREAESRLLKVKSIVEEIINDLARRRVDLAEVTLEEMKCHLAAALQQP